MVDNCLKMYACESVIDSHTIFALTKDEFEMLLKCNRTRALTERYRSGEDEAKKQQYCIVPAAAPKEKVSDDEGVERSAQSLIPNGKIYLDIDCHHIGFEPQAYYDQYLAPLLQRGDISVCAIQRTISGEGWHLVVNAEEKFGGTYKEQVVNFAKEAGILQHIDRAVTNHVSLCILSPWDDFVFLDLDALFSPSAFTPSVTKSFSSAKPAAQPAAQVAVPLIEGLDVETVIDALLEHEGMNPRDDKASGRNSAVFYLARTLGVWLTEDQLLQAIPTWGLPNYEFHQAIRNGKAASGFVAPETREVLNALKASEAQPEVANIAEAEAEVESADEGEADNAAAPNVAEYLLPRFVRVILKKFSATKTRRAVVVALYSMLAFIANGLRYKAMSGEAKNLVLLGVVYAPSGSGKSFLKILDQLILGPFRAHDDAERQRVNAFNEKLRLKNAGLSDDKADEANDSEKNKADKPKVSTRPKVRVIGASTLLQASQFLMNSQMSSIVVETELSNIANRNKFYDLSPLWLKAFESENYSSDSTSGLTNISIIPELSCIVSGTASSVQRYFGQNFEGGICSRLCMTSIDQRDELPFYNDLNAKDTQYVQEMIQKLALVGRPAGTTFEEAISTPPSQREVVDLKRTKAWLQEWQAKVKKDADLDPSPYNTARLQMSHRIVDIALRWAVLAWFLEDKKETKVVLDAARLCCDVCQHSQFEMFADRYTTESQYALQQKKNLKMVAENKGKATVLDCIAPNIGDKFTLESFSEWKAQNPSRLTLSAASTYKMISRWLKGKYIEKEGKEYRRIK